MNATTIALTILGIAALGALLFLWLQSRRRTRVEIPPALRPAYSDEQLETSVLERYMGWGLVLTLFFAVFLPLYFLNEPRRQAAKIEGDFVSTYHRGEELYEQFCSSCHGPDATGGAASSPYNPEDSWPAPNLTTIAARYADSTTAGDIRTFINTTIRRGRPGTPMPTWGADFGGPMTDQQIFDITDWILVNQVEEIEEPQAAANMSGAELFDLHCARCHGEDLQGVVGPSLIGVNQRHDEETLMGILRNGINMGNGIMMPPWQNGYMYPDGRLSDSALRKLVDYMSEQQPDEVPPGAQNFQTPGLGPADERRDPQESRQPDATDV